MWLDKVNINGFRNLRGLERGFDERHLNSVPIGRNSADKANLFEAMNRLFRWLGFRCSESRFLYRLTNRIQSKVPEIQNQPFVCLSNLPGDSLIRVDWQEARRTEVEKGKPECFPELVFGYYSSCSLPSASLLLATLGGIFHNKAAA